MDKCDCASKGLKIHSWDIEFRWSTRTLPDGKKEKRQSGRVHKPCGRPIKEKAVEIVDE